MGIQKNIRKQVNLSDEAYKLLSDYAKSLGPDTSFSTAIKILFSKKK